jgi:hypothetical protein
MAQSALTVTTPSPTPPTNMSFTGATPPNVPNYTKNTYNDTKNWGPGTATPPVFTPTNPPPYFDDGTAGSLIVFAANTGALASGSAGTAGGTEGTYPGAAAGAVPASTSVAHEGAGTETLVTQTYGPLVSPSPNGALQMIGCGPVNNTDALRIGGANANHASYLGAGASTLTSVTGLSNVSGIGTTTLTATGTNFRRDSVINVNGIPQNTTYVSATSLTAGSVVKRLTAGTVPCTVTTGGVTTAPQNWTLS